MRADNNHPEAADRQRQLSRLLRIHDSVCAAEVFDRALRVAEAFVAVEQCVAVVSDLTAGRSRIVAGKFGERIGLADYQHEDSIWEHRILDMMTEEARDAKFIAELRFFHHLRKVAPSRREEYAMHARLRFLLPGGESLHVLHRMYYLYDADRRNALCAICFYSPLTSDFTGTSRIINNVTGESRELSSASDTSLLSPRACQILTLIDSGKKSSEIAEMLHISIHTVHRHRQEILTRLNVKNSHEACRIAKAMSLI